MHTLGAASALMGVILCLGWWAVRPWSGAVGPSPWPSCSSPPRRSPAWRPPQSGRRPLATGEHLYRRPGRSRRGVRRQHPGQRPSRRHSQGRGLVAALPTLARLTSNGSPPVTSEQRASCPSGDLPRGSQAGVSRSRSMAMCFWSRLLGRSCSRRAGSVSVLNLAAPRVSDVEIPPTTPVPTAKLPSGDDLNRARVQPAFRSRSRENGNAVSERHLRVV